ncbi:MAG TPA: flagellar basal body P-ring formation chaperone FlgA [Methylocystis sp.]|jgi:flagella basal body P-ring formation protein FlgA
MVASFASALFVGTALADGRVVPTARITIYPGDRIDESMLEDVEVSLDSTSQKGVIESRNELVGKVARRTLLPGQAIPSIAVENPRLVKIGSQVKIMFSEDGLVITALGMALQAGSVGDLVRVRNQDSGLMVNGVVQSDGTIRVSEG